MGEFSFIVGSGNYYLKVNSTTHNFPSQHLAKLKPVSQDNQFVPGIHDSGYSNIYFGEIIPINKDDGPEKRYNLNINIPLDKTAAFNVEEKIVHFLRIIENILADIKWPSIIVGTALSIYSIWSDYSIFAVVILALYIILIAYELYLLLAKSRPYGLIKDEDNKAVDLAVIRFNNPKDKSRSTSISGRDGKFAAKVNPGGYHLFTKKVGFKENLTKINIKSIRKLEKLNITLKKQN